VRGAHANGDPLTAFRVIQGNQFAFRTGCRTIVAMSLMPSEPVSVRRGGRPPRDRVALSPREARFVAEYLIDLNGAAAVKRAGYRFTSGAAVGASKLLRLPKIAAAVVDGQRARLAAANLRAEDVLLELRRIAFSDPRELFDEQGSLRPIGSWPADSAASVAAFETTDTQARSRRVKIKFWDKLGALNTLAKHFQLLEPQPPSGALVIRWEDDD